MLEPCLIGRPGERGVIAGVISIAALAAVAVCERATQPTIVAPRAQALPRLDAPPVAAAESVQPSPEAVTLSEGVPILSSLLQPDDQESVPDSPGARSERMVLRAREEALEPLRRAAAGPEWKLDGDVLSYDGHAIRVYALHASRNR